MGAFESSEEHELAPPPPSRSTLFVVRNGRYEPQNLMPILPRPDMLDFDGFVVRRGNGQGRLNANPPEMKQASLLKSPLSLRRATIKAGFLTQPMQESGGHDEDAITLASRVDSKLPVISFVFDALTSGTLTLHQMVTEVETLVDSEEIRDEDTNQQDEGHDASKNKGPSSIKLVPREVPRRQKPEDMAFLLTEDDDTPSPPSLLHSCRIEKGVGQTYYSCPIDLDYWPPEKLAHDPTRPEDIPLAVRLESDAELGEESSIQYSYISIHPSSSPRKNTDGCDMPAQWSANVYAQKLQYGDRCFVLKEVFGVASKVAEVDVDGGNSDCVICLSEPRDTAVLPCRHMCFCSYCAGIVRLQCDRCPVCRQKVQSLLQFKRDQDEEAGQSVNTEVPLSTATATEVSASPNSSSPGETASSAVSMAPIPDTSVPS